LKIAAILASLILTVPWTGCLIAQDNPSEYPATEGIVKIELGLVSSIRDIEVPARVKGFISKVHFQEGEFVSEGDVITQLDTVSIDGELAAANIRLENARLQANDNTPVEYAEASYETALQEYQTERDLQSRGAATRQELERKRLTARQAQLQVVRSKAQKEIDAGAVRIEEQAVQAVEELKLRHSIDARFSGQIMSIERKEGEFVQEGQTVLRLVDLSQVKVEGRVNSSEFNAFEMKGKPVTVFLKLARGESAIFKGSVKSIGLDFQPAADGSSTYIVQAEVQNKQMNDEWLLHPGTAVSMEIQLD
jgi:multidrug efflux pump subunit AcrA (membrane-fusion protein)